MRQKYWLKIIMLYNQCDKLEVNTWAIVRS